MLSPQCALSDQIRAQLGGVLPHMPLVPLKQTSDITCHVSDTDFDFPRGQRCRGSGCARRCGGETRQCGADRRREDLLQPHLVLQRTVPALLSLEQEPEGTPACPHRLLPVV